MAVGSYDRRKQRREKDKQRAAQGNETGRKREVYDNDMVAHIWANQSQDSARNWQKNFYFTDTTIYSYGSHFPIADIVTHKGKKCVWFTTDSRSITTSRHMSTVRGALRGTSMPVFNVTEVLYSRESVKKNIDSYGTRIIALAKKVKRARANKDWKLSELEELVAEANKFAEMFSHRISFRVPTDFDLAAEEAKVKKAAARDAAARDKRDKERQREMEKELVKHNTALEHWVKGFNVPRWSYLLADDQSNTRLRINREDDTIETSRGAQCPIKHALRILPLIRAGKEYVRNGHTEHLGHFTVDRIDAEGNLYAGCHTVKRAEIERIATLLGHACHEGMTGFQIEDVCDMDD